MTAARYKAMISWFAARPVAKAALRCTAKGAVALVYALYAGLLVCLVWWRSVQFWAVLVVPALVFASGTLLRAAINRPRPYQALGFAPLFPKATTGKSMPSRHCFSAAAIAVAAAWVWAPLGTFAALLALCIAATRVLTGVHYPSDVLVGLGYGTAVAMLGFCLAGIL